MRRMWAYIVVVSFTITTMVMPCSAASAGLTDDQILAMVDSALAALPERVNELSPDIRRVAFYSFKVDRDTISTPLFKQVYGKIESAFLRVGRPTIIYAPEIKPLRVVSRGKNINFVSGFESSDEAKSIADKLRLDGYLEGELYVTKNNVYLNLRIINAQTLAVVWSNSIANSRAMTDKVEKRKTTFDLGLGVAGMQVTATSSSAGMILPDFAKYYLVDMRVLQATQRGDKLKLSLSAGMYALTQGIDSGTKVTIVSKDSFMNFFFRVGLRLSLIPIIEKVPSPRSQDWLATEFYFGKMMAEGTSVTDMYGVRFESDITETFSMAIGISYVPATEVTFATNKTAKVGGMTYELSLLRIHI